MHNITRTVLASMLGLISPALYALGLGGATVESYLNQPLDVRVELISQSGEELQSITARMASADDFELVGLSRAAIVVPMTFEVVADDPQPHIRITSDLTVNEPVLQVLVEVAWSGGRMLREYTLFLDPPTIESAAPPAPVRPAVPAPAPQRATPTERSRPATDTPADTRPPAPVREQTVAEPRAAELDTTDSSAANDADDIYGPVANGETLWGIASNWSRGTAYSTNQAMLAMLRKNPQAFKHENINTLMRGAILRMPTPEEMGELSSREAMLEAIRQEEEFRGGMTSLETDISTPTLADSGDYQDSSAPDDSAVTIPEADDGHLELVPPAQDLLEETESAEEDEAPAEEQATAAVSQPTPVPAATEQAVRENLARTEEELVNARQENRYLNERIRELEAEVAAERERALEVEDTDLAKMESALAQDRARAEPEPPVAVTPGGESTPWYGGMTAWLAGGAVIVIGLVVWLLRRRSRAGEDLEPVDEHEETVEDTPGYVDEELVATQAAEEYSEPEPVLETVPVAPSEPPFEKPARIEPRVLEPVPEIVDEAAPQFVEEPESAPEFYEEPEAVPELVEEPEPAPEFFEEPEAAPEFFEEPEAAPQFFEELKPAPEFVEEPEPAPEFIEDPESTPEAAPDTIAAEREETSTPPEQFEGQVIEFEQEEIGPGADNPEINLDLARAYLSMGDKEAARSMLEEVLNTGNPAQKAEAREMMEEL